MTKVNPRESANTIFGWVPVEWKILSVQELFHVQLGKMLNQTAKDGASQYPYIANFNVQWGRVDTSRLQTMFFSDREKEKYALHAGDLLVCEGGDVGRTAIWRNEVPDCFYQKAIHRLRPVNECITPEFMMYFMNFISGRKILSDLTSQSSIAHLTREKLLKLPVLVPPISEQHGITRMLLTWDSYIEKIENLVKAKSQLKRGLLQQLLMGKKRFSNHQRDNWAWLTLGEVASESRARNNGSKDSNVLMAVTKVQGMVPMRERVQGDSVERCKVVSKDWFAYNPMRLNIGSIAKWEGDEDVLVSPDYVVFKCDEKRLDPDFLNHFRRTRQWSNFVERSGDGSVRVRIYFSHLASLKMHLPPIEEQRQIAQLLNACDKEIMLLKQQLDALKRQKRGLMQKLLTGQIRVKVGQAEAATVEAV